MLNNPKQNRWNQLPGLPVLTSSHRGALERKLKADTLPLRSGALAIKKGMTAVYDEETGKRTPCTVLQIDRCQVVSHKTRPEHGYWAVQVGTGFRHPSNVTRPELGHYARYEVAPKKKMFEFRVRDGTGLPTQGSLITPTWFLEGQFVDVRAKGKGKGFAGVMKRHGMGGQPASHGQSLTHRTMGSAGGGQGSGSRVLPGKRMPGNMGGERVTVKNLRVLKVDEENGLVVVNGKFAAKCRTVYDRADT